MSISNLTYIEALAELEQMMGHPENITKASLEALVERVSVVDPVAVQNATIYLYSGVSTDLNVNAFTLVCKK
ncbi:hypothetical protein LY28_03294 [Ruminiclostridium sufflavum DSM 19573]|uniref:Uncharacterized protein n=1 Tax=Ruminiclostridium sufflavum DSM 19573 TaxID=1121337 RepID=A0A318Y222_9FIRM|nr:hypothetical protein [Ruminiclostridium sufflavum]PYG85606.1 hypothetical protein LY28_03294 [Ruminiclostridium sufflavum DSM 19573]